MSQPTVERTSNEPESKTQPVRAAQYVRMSTEHQQYSTLNQEDVIHEYAEHYEILDNIELSATILRVEKNGEGLWQIELKEPIQESHR